MKPDEEEGLSTLRSSLPSVVSHRDFGASKSRPRTARSDEFAGITMVLQLSLQEIL